MDLHDKTGIWKDVRDEFAISDDIAYFNHAAISPLSVTTRRALDNLSAILSGGALVEDDVFARVAEVRSAVAALIGAEPDEIAFVKNTTHGVQIASGGIRWKDGDNVILPSIEFPANVYPWMGLWQRGVELRMVEPDEGLITAEMLAGVCDSRTRAVTVSQVQFSTGQRIDLGELGDFCRNKGILLHVDGIQGLGALELDVKKSKVDFLSVGGHKWMMALPGVGIFFCRKELLDQIDIWNPGWTGVVNPKDFLDYEFKYRDSAERFEEGSPNLHGIFALGVSIDRILRLGKGTVEKRIMSLTGLLIEGLSEKGFKIKSPMGDGQRSGILCFYSESEDAQSIFYRLRDAGIVCSLRENAVRLSPHMYNTEDECERVLEIAAGR